MRCESEGSAWDSKGEDSIGRLGWGGDEVALGKMEQKSRGRAVVLVRNPFLLGSQVWLGLVLLSSNVLPRRGLVVTTSTAGFPTRPS